MRILSSVILVLGFMLAVAIEPRAQTVPAPSGTCVWVSTTGTGSAVTAPNFTCVDLASLIPAASAPAGASGATASVGGPCTPVTGVITIYAQDPVSKNCLPLIPVAAPGLVVWSPSGIAVPVNAQNTTGVVLQSQADALTFITKFRLLPLSNVPGAAAAQNAMPGPFPPQQ